MSNLIQSSFPIHIKKAFPKSQIRELRRIVEQEEKTRELLTEPTLKFNDSGIAPNDLRLRQTWWELWNHANQVIINKLGSFSYGIYPSQIRHIKSEDEKTHVPWHQDIGYVRQMKVVHHSFLTCFVPLDPDPYNRTTLEFSKDRTAELPHKTISSYGIGLENVNLTDTYHFLLEEGDLILFDHLTIHRTMRPKNCLGDRCSLEFRFVQDTELKQNKDYWDLQNGKLIQLDN